ncbi:unnamed protein product [Amoebophrya sp. A120]|nr:unnamed protein product [Amoebophrya sp. A120]|eukprot:GSA120T00019734001.1
MVKFVGFAVRHELDQPMNPMKICKNLFVAQSLTNRVQSLVDNALSAPSRER